MSPWLIRFGTSTCLGTGPQGVVALIVGFFSFPLRHPPAKPLHAAQNHASLPLPPSTHPLTINHYQRRDNISPSACPFSSSCFLVSLFLFFFFLFPFSFIALADSAKGQQGSEQEEGESCLMTEAGMSLPFPLQSFLSSSFPFSPR